eukprot:GILK01003476.1.p1 GENE.GILK01003476.1~~GILK01003476.1.p1  ORF type:complete len:839 (+),score=153.48 GILK01003476.1:104-2518(+)
MKNQLLDTRGTTTFECVQTDPSSSAITLFVAVKKHLHRYRLVTVSQGFQKLNEIVLPTTPRLLTSTSGGCVCVGFAREYAIVDLETGTSLDVFPTGRAAQPTQCRLAKRELLLSKDTESYIVGYDGKPTRGFFLNWNDIPSSLGFASPYVVCSTASKIVVRSYSTGSLVQSFSLPGGVAVSVREENRPYKAPSFFVATKNQICRFTSISLQHQVQELIETNEYEEALALTEICDEENLECVDSHQLRDLHARYAFHLFCHKKDFELSAKHFELTECDVRKVVGLFPELLPLKLSNSLHYVPPLPPPTFQGPEFQRALTSLVPYLNKNRLRIGSSVNQLQNQRVLGENFDQMFPDEDDNDLSTAIDLLLFRAYLTGNNDEELERLLRERNGLPVQEVERVLIEKMKYLKLIIFFEGKGLHRRALEFIRQLSQRGTDGSMAAISMTEGLQHMTRYLNRLGNTQEKLVFEYAKWVLQNNKDLGIEIFTNSLHPIASDKVLKYLRDNSTNGNAACVSYLESLVEKNVEENDSYHDQLAQHYLDIIMNLLPPAGSSTQRLQAGTEPGQIGITRRKLLNFFEKSNRYHAERLLNIFPMDDLLEERALILRRMGRHEQALNIYVHKLGHHELALQYCDKVFDPNVEGEAKSVFTFLIEDFLIPPSGSVSGLQTMLALDLLTKHFDKIDPLRALDLLPGNIPVFKIRGYIDSVLKDLTEKRRAHEISKNLLKSETLLVKQIAFNCKNKPISITPITACPVCNKRIGESAFAMYPNGILVHYACSKDRHVCPVTGDQFDFTRPIRKESSLSNK